MSERQGPGHGLSEHELSEIRMLIEERTGICFDESRERFFSTRVREHLRAKGLERGTDLLRCVRKSNVEYEALLEGLLTQETSFFRYPGVYEAFEKRVLPELHTKKFWKNPRSSPLARRCSRTRVEKKRSRDSSKQITVRSSISMRISLNSCSLRPWPGPWRSLIVLPFPLGYPRIGSATPAKSRRLTSGSRGNWPIGFCRSR